MAQANVVITMRRVDAILDLVRAYLPRLVDSSGDFEDWEVISSALVAIVADLFEGIMGCVPPKDRVRAEILARSEAEYAIVFAWLAADDAERQRRIRQLLRDEFEERGRAANQLEREIAGRRIYADLFDDEKRLGAALPKALLDDRAKARLAELENDESATNLPNAFDMAYAADKSWMPRIDTIKRNPYALVYFTLFTGPSFSTHPSITAVSNVVTGTPPQLAVGAARPLGESEMPYGQSYLVLANTLLVAARSLGWPEEEQVLDVMLRG